MKNYFLGLFFLLLLSGCDKDPILPDNDDPEDITGLPTLITDTNTNITIYSISLSGSLIDEGDSKVFEAGFVFDTVPNPTIIRNSNKFIVLPDQNKLMVIKIENIPANSTYYFRSYATNNQGTGYGNEMKFTSLPQNIFKGNVTLSTQQEVENFGNEKHTTINGSLEITGTVTDLSPLKDLVLINYAFDVKNTTQLTNLKGMDNLEMVNYKYFFHGMQIGNNKALKSLEGLEKLIRSNGEFYIINNDELVDLNGLNNFRLNYFGEFRIDGCEKLRNLHGIENFEWLDGDIMIIKNPVLEDISAFEKLNFMTGRIRIINNASIQNVHGFEGLKEVDGIEVYDNEKLSDIKGFCNLERITSIILIRNNSALKDLSGLEKIMTCEFLTIENSPALSSLKGLENLNNIKYHIRISNSGLTNFNELGNLTQTQYLGISNNEKLQNLSGLSKLTLLTGSDYSLSISSNNQLKSLAGLDNLTKADGQIYIGYNKALNDFCPLKSLLKPGRKGELIIEGNEVNPKAADIISCNP